MIRDCLLKPLNQDVGLCDTPDAERPFQVRLRIERLLDSDEQASTVCIRELRYVATALLRLRGVCHIDVGLELKDQGLKRRSDGDDSSKIGGSPNILGDHGRT